MKIFSALVTLALALPAFAQTSATYENCPTFPASAGSSEYNAHDLDVNHIWYATDGSVTGGYMTRGYSTTIDNGTSKTYVISSRLSTNFFIFSFSDQGGPTASGDSVTKCVSTLDKKQINFSFDQGGSRYDIEVYQKIDPTAIEHIVHFDTYQSGVLIRREVVKKFN